jgi:cysteine synthase
MAKGIDVLVCGVGTGGMKMPAERIQEEIIKKFK